MKKLLFILLLAAGCAGIGFSQNMTYYFQYISDTGNPSCNPDWHDWYISHGSPSYVFPDYVKLISRNLNGDKSEGMFVNYSFSKNNNYQIAVSLKETGGTSRIELYGASGLPVNKDPNCNEAPLPNASYKQLIAGVYIGSYYYITVPSNLSYWNPDRNYNYLWITSNNPGNTSSFIMNMVSITDLGKVELIPPTDPGNLRTTLVEAEQITVEWDPSTDNTKVEGYEVFLNGTSKGTTTKTEYTFTGLTECTKYTIEVRAFDPYDNYSGKASIKVQTTPDLPADVVLERPVDLSIYLGKRYIVQALNSITMKPGFSVKANDVREYFHARISTGCGDALLSAFPPEEEYPYSEEEIIETLKSSLPSDTDADILIYPNPASEMITVEYHQFTGVEKILIFDITGKPLLDYRLSGVVSNVDVSAFSSGMYVIKVITQDQVLVQKLIKR